MYLSTHKKKVKDKIYISYSLRTSYRDTKGKVRHKHIANLPKCTDEEIKALRLALTFKGKLEELGSIEDISITNESSFGGTYVLYQVAKKLGIEKVLGNSKNGKLALWQIIARILGRGSRLSAKRMMSKYSADHILDLEEVDKNMLYKNLDWLEENQEAMEKKLWELRGGKKIDLYLYDVTSSYLEGSCNELATYGYNRDKKKGKEQIVVGLLTDDEGFPVAARVFEGNTSDSKTIQKQIEILRDKFGCKNVTLVGDRGMLKTPQIDALPKGFNYITGIGKPTIKKLEKEGIFQYSLFDKEIHEISHNDIRYIMRRNPLIAEESAEWRRGRIASIVKLVEEKNKYLIDKPRASIGAAVKAVEKLVDKYKLKKIITFSNQNRVIKTSINEEELELASKYDGCYCLKTDLPDDVANKEKIHERYKQLTQVESAFREMKGDILNIRPLYLRKAERTKGHIVVVMLGYMILHKINNLWSSVKETMEESLDVLTNLCVLKVESNESSILKLPTPNEECKNLLNLAKIKWPKFIIGGAIV